MSAAQVLRHVLVGGEWVDSARVVEVGAAEGVSRRALQREGRKLGVEIRRTRSVPPRSQWRLILERPVEDVCVLDVVEDVPEGVVGWTSGPGRQSDRPPPAWPGAAPETFERMQF